MNNNNLPDPSPETYFVVLICDNCNTDNKVEIEKGTTVYNFLQTPRNVCEFCGCSDNLRKAAFRYVTP